MAQNLTQTTLVKSKELNKRPNIVLKIDGLDEIFGALNIETSALYGQGGLTYGKPNLVYGGAAIDPNSRDYISLQGSSTKISQQLKQDKGAISSVTTINIKLIDVGEELSELFAPGFILEDLLSTSATVYFMFDETRFPEDAVVLLQGLITKISADAASFTLKISHPEQLKRQQLFTEETRELSGSINNSVTTITLDDTTDYVVPVSDFQTYVLIGDELLEYTAISGNDLTVIRGQLNTIAEAHSNEDEVGRFYRLKGKAIDISLKLMLSTPGETYYYINEFEATNFTSVRFKALRLSSNFGVTAGDFIDIFDGETFLVEKTINRVVEDEQGTLLFFTHTLVNATYTAKIKSRYNVWPIGLSMKPGQVDIEEHERILGLFNARFPDMDIYVKEQVEGKEFISKRLMFPNGLYVIPRKGRVSIGITVPPLADFQTQVLDEKSILNPDKLTVVRSVNENFYNSVVYKFNQDSLEDDFLNKLAVFSASSLKRINALKNNPLIIEADGFRPESRTQILNQANAFLRRFQFAADFVSGVELDLRTGFNIDVGDRAIFGSPALKIYDSIKGSRSFSPRVMEVVNKSFSFQGRVTVDLLDTNFTIARYGVISPSSEVESLESGALTLKPSFTTIVSLGEAQKWERYIGEFVKIYNSDFSVVGVASINGVVDSNPNQLRISDPGIAVVDGMKMSIANYSDAGDLSKSLHCFWNPSVAVSSGASGLEFDVADASKLFIGSAVRVNNADYTNESPEVLIEAIDGLTVTVDSDLGFTPANGDKLKLIGFKSDKGLPYRIL